jgi:predicted nucleic acid-binding protein
MKSTKDYNKSRLIRGGRILYLTYYEAGNAIWKESELVKSLSKEDLEALVSAITKVLPFLEILPLSYEDFSEILDIARNEHLTFYDSSYVHSAKKNKLTLISDDTKVSRVAKKYVNTKSIHELL